MGCLHVPTHVTPTRRRRSMRRCPAGAPRVLKGAARAPAAGGCPGSLPRGHRRTRRSSPSPRWGGRTQASSGRCLQDPARLPGTGAGQCPAGSLRELL